MTNTFPPAPTKSLCLPGMRDSTWRRPVLWSYHTIPDLPPCPIRIKIPASSGVWFPTFSILLRATANFSLFMRRIPSRRHWSFCPRERWMPCVCPMGITYGTEGTTSTPPFITSALPPPSSHGTIPQFRRSWPFQRDINSPKK